MHHNSSLDDYSLYSTAHEVQVSAILQDFKRPYCRRKSYMYIKCKGIYTFQKPIKN